ncbi:hypothetical protein GKE82_04015 [Conexibacter sp. W3-3-2]|uniref:Uncharacterized protein n=1 Tax=Paraconexibacter algicola TaxID=2133960 RepID=A0A2T4UD56_9ACTN|nr:MULTISPECIES: hypothetical protein [Solirubrobacterales]MTD43488.1 hypothetical protein [Conexibacter sp. W3-3-2]PTL55424.1 hypothetical protein C7Y72_17345 [Paraconexibacter algicola]
MTLEAEVAAIILTLVVHVIGAVVLVWAMFDGDNRPDWRSLWPDDEDGGGGPDPIEPEPMLPGGPDLLPESAPARIRLREPGRLADAHPRPARRPDHAPQPARVPERTGAE